MHLFYLLFFLLIIQSVVFPCRKRQQKIIFLLLSFIELQIISGLRIPLGGDSEYYTDLFVETSTGSFSDSINYGLEKGFMVFCYLVSLISKRPQALVFCSSLVVNALILYYVYRNSKNIWLSVVLYMTFMFFFNSMNLIRFTMASSILLYSNKYVVSRSLFKFLLVVLLAFSFHFSAALYAIIYCIYPVELKIKNFFLVSTPFVIVFMAFLTLFQLLIQLNDRYTSYENSGEFYQSSYANILEFLFSIFLFWFVVYRKKWTMFNISGNERLYIWLMFISMAFYLMSINVMIIIRLALIFSLISIIYIPNLISEMRNASKIRWTLVFLFVSFTKMAVILTYRPEWYFGEPYRNWLF